uniref:Uncharacterized protein n=1 Tax=Anguilla anguilla TaxID=7936 RepID=A0A0E9VDF6_ANGAN
MCPSSVYLCHSLSYSVSAIYLFLARQNR